MASLLSFLWLIRTSKVFLFYLYLWQLKEYHFGRFLDHFRTEKGKRLLFNPINILKFLLILSFPSAPPLPFFIAFFIYLFESIKALSDFLKGRIKKPVLTQKTLFLTIIGFLIIISFVALSLFYVQDIAWLTFWLLLFDVLLPLIVSVIVLFFQPLAVFGRNQIIKRATKKRQQFKNLLVVGITGSFGKTSTKEFLYQILIEKFAENKILKTKEHQNSEELLKSFYKLR